MAEKDKTMNPKEEAIALVADIQLVLPQPPINIEYEEYIQYFTRSKVIATYLAMKQIEAIIKFGNEMGIREPMMKYNKILEELKKL